MPISNDKIKKMLQTAAKFSASTTSRFSVKDHFLEYTTQGKILFRNIHFFQFGPILQNLEFKDCIFEQCNFSHLLIEYCDFINCELIACVFTGLHTKYITGLHAPEALNERKISFWKRDTEEVRLLLWGKLISTNPIYSWNFVLENISYEKLPFLERCHLVKKFNLFFEIYIDPSFYKSKYVPVGWKLHISVDPRDVPTAFNIAAHILLKHGIKNFKVININDYNKKDIGERLYEGGQITAYLCSNGDALYPAESISLIMEEMNTAFLQNNIRPGSIPESDASTKFPYFSFRNDFNITAYFADLDDIYTLGLLTGKYHNPFRLLNPFDALLNTGESQKETDILKQLNSMSSYLKEESELYPSDMIFISSACMFSYAMQYLEIEQNVNTIEYFSNLLKKAPLLNKQKLEALTQEQRAILMINCCIKLTKDNDYRVLNEFLKYSLYDKQVMLFITEIIEILNQYFKQEKNDLLLEFRDIVLNNFIDFSKDSKENEESPASIRI